VRIRPALIDRGIAREVVRFSIPVWFSHALYAVGAAIEVALLARLMGDGAAGVYAFTRTLCFAFDFLPSAIGTMIMPRAAVASDSRRLIQLSAALVLAVNAVFGLVFIAVYPWFVGSFFDASYLLPNTTVLIMIAAQTLAGLLGVVQSVTVGKNRPNLELVSRLIWVALLFGACLALIPPFGVQGAALASLITAVVGLAMFPLLLALSRGRRADGAPAINQEAA
jgi:O-antigen/teichoic acid export membrane protein